MSQKVMVIGLDGAAWTILGPWISDNKLPTLKKIADSGSIGILKSTIPCTTVPALPSMLTGMNPGNHGIFSFIKPDGSPITIRDVKYPRIWTVLDKHNFRSCIVGVRTTFPPERLCGTMISGSVPSDKSDYTYPKSLKKEIGRFHDDRIEKEIFKGRNKKRDEKYRKKLVDLIIKETEKRYGTFKKLNQDKDYDFSLLWIEETDRIQHYFWEYKDSLLRFYVRVDNILSDALSSFPDTNFFIVSDHGFESTAKQFFFVNTWLQREGYLRQKGGTPLRLLVNLILLLAFNNIRPLGLETTQARLLRLIKRTSNQKIAMTRLDNFPVIDKTNSKAYLATPFGININSPSNYEVVREEIIEKLRKLKNQEGERVVRDVWKKEEIYAGKYLQELPDIIFITSEKYVPFPALTNHLFGSANIRRTLWWRSGEHYRARDGILMAYGPVIRKSNDLGIARIEDLFPTILHLMGCAIPKNVDGGVLTEIFKKNSEPVSRQPFFKDFAHISESHKLERREAEKIKERLRGLGYI